MDKIKVRAKLKNLDITPRKVRRVAEVLKGLQVDNALAELSMSKTRGAAPLTKLIHSAVANAKEKKVSPHKLVIDSIKVDQGRTLKRLLPQARGRASLIRKRFSHVAVELALSDASKPKGFIIPKKVKKARGSAPSNRPVPKPTEASGKPKEKTGFMQKVFRRKVV